MRASHIQWIDRQWKSWSIRELVIVYVQLFFFSSSFLYSIPTVECCAYMTNLKLSLNRASLSLSLYNTTYIARLYNSRGNYAGILFNWEKTTTSFDITDGGCCCCCCCAPSSFMENLLPWIYSPGLATYYIGPPINRENWGEIIAGTVQPTEQLLTYLPR